MSGREAIIVADLGFGDAGKGTTIDYLARTLGVGTVVRFNGGAQAAHNVVAPDGRHHTFSQFGSGTFVPGMRTHLSRFMLLDPIELAAEARQLTDLGLPDPFALLTIDADALVVTPFHRAANRVRERTRGSGEHGTCGMGIGETMADAAAFDDAVRVRDLRSLKTLAEKFAVIQWRKRQELASLLTSEIIESLPEEVETLIDIDYPARVATDIVRFSERLQIVSGELLSTLADAGPLLFEGAQGVLLDEWHGFHPHTTWSTTTFENAATLLDEMQYTGSVTKLGVLRAYHTRHGAGPFVTYDPELSRLLPEPHNGEVGWQGTFRCGWFDLVMARYAQAVAGADALAITHLDRYRRIENAKVCVGYQCGDRRIDTISLGPFRDLDYQASLTALLHSAEPVYEQAPESAVAFPELIETHLSVPVTITSHGLTALDKRQRY